jgi:DNA-directed RNA polymerase specialized sigma24 family protein
MKPGGEAPFEPYHARAYRYFRRVTQDHQEAQDLVQELFLRLLVALKGYEASERETEWVFRSLRRFECNDPGR